MFSVKHILSVEKVLYATNCDAQIQSTLVISKSKGLSETPRDIRSSTYQMCSIEENTNGITKFHK